MTKYAYDHIHLRSRNPQVTAAYYRDIFDAKVVEAPQPNGQPRIELDLDGIVLLVASGVTDPDGPSEPHLGLDHFGLRVGDLDDTVTELKRRGADILEEPRTIRPGVKVAYVKAPENVRIELLQRD